MTSYIFHYDEPAVAEPGDEISIQVRIRKAIKSRLRNCEFVAVPNGTQRTAWTALNAKREGMKSGFPDGMIIWPGGVAFAEIKARSGDLSDNQIDWLNRLTNMGHKAGCFRSVETVIAWLVQQGAPLAGSDSARSNRPTPDAVIRALLTVVQSASTKEQMQDAIDFARQYLGLAGQARAA